jgi:hypothetical protein
MDHIADSALDLGIFALDSELQYGRTRGSTQKPRDTTIFKSLKERDPGAKVPPLPAAPAGA